MWARVVHAVARRARTQPPVDTATRTRSLHTYRGWAHVHSASCSHGAPPTANAGASSSVGVPAAAGSPPVDSTGRPLPPVLAKGEMPPGDNPLLPGWYQRPLPHSLIPFASNRGKQVFKEAMVKGGMEGYFALAEQFQTQSTPSYCGPGTLAMVLNALALDPKRLWKGNWRWFSEEMLETCDIRKPADEPLHGVDVHGLSFEEFLFLAECNGAHVRALRANESSLGKFRAAIATATTRTDLHIVASFSRKVLGQTGSGHYSPIGGYHAELDLALVLDVARFKYPPYWAPVPLLWKAICDTDEATGQGRGYYLMSKGKLAAQVPTTQQSNESIFTPLSSACRIAVDKDSWSRLAEHFCSVLPQQLESQYASGEFAVPPDTLTPATPPTPSSSAPSSVPSSLDLQTSLIFRSILLHLPVELSSIFMMYTHDLSERMIARYQREEQNKTTTDAATPASADECTASSSCAVHPSPLSMYHTLLPKHTPHQHTHSIPAVHALQPLLKSVEGTRMFAVVQHAEIDFAALETKASSGHHLLAGSLDGELELATLLLFACPDQIFSRLPSSLQQHIGLLRAPQALSPELQLEVRNLRAQMGILAEFCLCGAAPSIKGNDNPNIDPADVQQNEAAAKRGLHHIADQLHAAHHGESEQQHQQQHTSPTTARPASRRSSPASSQPPATVAHRFVSGSRSKKNHRAAK